VAINLMPRKTQAVTELVCDTCGMDVSGPDAAAVAATIERHTKKKHGAKRARKPKSSE
jgi:hypothetical protein